MDCEVLEGQELLGSPGALTTGREAMQDLVRWPGATGGCSSAGFVPAGLSHEEVAGVQCLALGTQLPAAGRASRAGCGGALFEAEEEAGGYLHAVATPRLNQITSR